MANPGSLNDFMQAGDYGSVAEAMVPYFDAQHVYRVELAAENGLSLDELHDSRQAIGSRAVLPELKVSQ